MGRIRQVQRPALAQLNTAIPQELYDRLCAKLDQLEQQRRTRITTRQAISDAIETWLAVHLDEGDITHAQPE